MITLVVLPVATRLLGPLLVNLVVRTRDLTGFTVLILLYALALLVLSFMFLNVLGTAIHTVTRARCRGVK